MKLLQAAAFQLSVERLREDSGPVNIYQLDWYGHWMRDEEVMGYQWQRLRWHRPGKDRRGGRSSSWLSIVVTEDIQE